MKKTFEIQAEVFQAMDIIWKTFNETEHVMRWSFASDDWHVTEGKSNFREGGAFNYRMEAKDGSDGFNFMGTYDQIIPNQSVKYHLTDKRKVEVIFKPTKNSCMIIMHVDAESVFPLEQQKSGWQAILNNFKKYAEQYKESR